MARVDLKTLDREECRATFDAFWEVGCAAVVMGLSPMPIACHLIQHLPTQLLMLAGRIAMVEAGADVLQLRCRPPPVCKDGSMTACGCATCPPGSWAQGLCCACCLVPES